MDSFTVVIGKNRLKWQTTQKKSMSCHDLFDIGAGLLFFRFGKTDLEVEELLRRQNEAQGTNYVQSGAKQYIDQQSLPDSQTWR